MAIMCLYFSVVYFDVQVQAGAHYFFLLFQYYFDLISNLLEKLLDFKLI